MIPIETWMAFTAACVLIILVPGPDNILAVSRGLSQGRLAWISHSTSASTALRLTPLNTYWLDLHRLLFNHFSSFRHTSPFPPLRRAGGARAVSSAPTA